jgi:hypothetical protein
MFQIRDANQEYGPYTATQVKQLGDEGRLSGQMFIRRLPDGTWQPMTSVPELVPFVPAPVLERMVTPAPAFAPPAQPVVNIETDRPIVRYYANKKASSASHSFGIGAIILGAIGLLLCWIPLVGIGLPALGVLMGFTGVFLSVSRRGFGLGFAIAGIAVSGVALMSAIAITTTTFTVVKALTDEVKRQTTPVDLSPKREATDASHTTGSNRFDVEEWNVLVNKYNSAIKQKAFRILEATIDPPDKLSFMGTPTIRLRVHNGTQYAIRRAYFHARLVTPGRSVPWVDADFNYEIPGGMEPGESAAWGLQPNIFDSDWRHVEDAQDATFSVTVLKLEGSDGRVLFPQWTQAEENRLNKLKEIQGTESPNRQEEKDDSAKLADSRMYYTVEKLDDLKFALTVHNTPLGNVRGVVVTNEPRATGMKTFQVGREANNPSVTVEYANGKVTSAKWDGRQVRPASPRESTPVSREDESGSASKQLDDPEKSDSNDF